MRVGGSTQARSETASEIADQAIRNPGLELDVIGVGARSIGLEPGRVLAAESIVGLVSPFYGTAVHGSVRWLVGPSRAVHAVC